MLSRLAIRVSIAITAAVVIPACGSGSSGGGSAGGPGVLAFIAAVLTGNENVPTALVTVRRTSGSSGAVSVTYATSNGTAVAGADYTATGGTLSWAAGDATDKSFTVAMTDDGAIEGNETVLLALSLPTGGAALGANSNAVLSIADDEAPVAGVIQFSAVSYSVNESSATATITVTRTGGSTNAAAVTFSDAGTGSATGAGTDFTLASGTLNWAAGDAADKTFTVAISADALAEANETVALQLTAPAGAVLGTTVASTLTIVDDDSPGTLQLSAAAYTVSESGLLATITVTRTGGVGGTASVSFATSAGTATVVADYAQAAGTLNWPAGDASSRTFTVPVVDDPTVEGDETVNLTLSTAVGAALGAPLTGLLTLRDDDCTLQFSAATYSLTEGAATASITVSRVGATAEAVGVGFSNPVGGTATAGGTDYTFTAGTLSWAAGDGANKTISIPVSADALAEGDETVNLSLANATGVGARLGIQAAAVFTIVDNDVLFQFSAAASSVAEGAGTTTITVNRVGASTGAASVDWTTPAGGTATVATDYTAVPATLNWPSGDSTPQTFTITIVNDAVAEPNETLNLGLANPTLAGGTAGLGTPGAAVVTITNDDSNLQFSLSAQSVAETVAVATVTVTRTGLTSGACSVSWGIAGTSTATGGGVDYAATPGLLSWAAGDAVAKTFTITTVNDLLVEGDETVNLTLSGAAGATLGAQATQTVTILDDDAPGSLQFTAATFNVTEGTASINVTVSRTGGIGGTVSADWSITGGTATGPGAGGSNDFNTTPSGSTTGTLTWTPGDAAAKSITISIADDLLLDANPETVLFSLGNPQGGATIGTQNTATLNIADNDLPGVLAFSAAAFNVTEGTASINVTVSRTGGVGGTVSADWSITGGTATGPGAGGANDFNTTPSGSTTGTLTWTPGDAAAKSIVISVADDLLLDANPETVIFSLGNPQGGATIGTQNTATLNIADNDLPGVLAFSAAAFNVTEGTASINVTVSRTGGVGGTVSADWSITGGTATGPGAGGANDFDTTPSGSTTGTLTWTPGDAAAKSITISVADDSLTDVNPETVLFSLGNPQGGATIGTQNTATLNIADNDIPGTLAFTAAGFTVAEGTASINLTVSRTGGTSGAVQVTWTRTGGTATGPGAGGANDYDTSPSGSTTGTLNWSNSEGGSKSITITIADDATAEAPETAVFTLSSPTGSASLGQAVATLTINDNEAPSVLSNTPTNGAPNVNLDVNMVLNFSQPMNTNLTEAAVGIDRVPTTSPDPTPVFVWSNGNQTLTILFDTTAPAGTTPADIHADDLLHDGTTYTVTVGTGAQSAFGTPLSAPFSTNFGTWPDATPPTLVSVTPSSTFTALVAPGTTTITILCNETLSTTNGRVEVYGGGIDGEAQIGPGGYSFGGVSFTVTGSQINITVPALPAASAFEIDASGFYDISGNRAQDILRDGLMVTSNPGADAVAPRVTGSFPQSGATGISRDGGIIIGFSEILHPDIKSKVTVSGSATTGIPVDMYNDDATISLLVIIPRRAWLTGTVTVTIDCSAGTGARDLKGNALVPTTVNSHVISYTTVAGTAAGIEIDTAASGLKNGATNVDQFNFQTYLQFNYTSTTTRAYLNRMTVGARDVRIIDTVTSLPVKGHQVDPDDETGSLRISRFEPKISQLTFGRTYSIALASTFQNSRGVAITPPAPYTFTVRNSGVGANVFVHDPPELNYDTLPTGTNRVRVYLDTYIQNPAAAGGETITANIANTVPPNSFSQSTVSLAGSFGLGWNFESAVPEPGVQSTGVVPMTLTASDSQGTSVAVTTGGYVFPATELNATLNSIATSTDTTPTYSWSWPGAVPASIMGAFILITDQTSGDELYAAILDRTATTFTQPADRPLPPGTYTFTLYLIRFKEGINHAGIVDVGLLASPAFTINP